MTNKFKFRASIILALLASSLSAFDLDSALAKLSGQQFDMESSYAGMYKYFDSTNSKWFLYLPASSYLKIHETGKPTTSLGAKTFTMDSFVNTPSVENLSVIFSAQASSSTDSDIAQLSSNTYSLGTTYSGFYKLFDTENNLWFLWMPNENYLKIHETGKATTAEGAIVVNISDTFESGISFNQDPFGDTIGNTIQFSSLKSGVITTINNAPTFGTGIETSLSLTVDEYFELDISDYASDIDGDSITYTVSGLGNGLSFDSTSNIISGTPLVAVTSSTILIYANDGNGGTSSHSITLSVSETGSSTDIETPPEVPTIEDTTSSIPTPPQVPSI